MACIEFASILVNIKRTFGYLWEFFGVCWEYLRVYWEYFWVQWEYLGVCWEYLDIITKSILTIFAWRKKKLQSEPKLMNGKKRVITEKKGKNS